MDFQRSAYLPTSGKKGPLWTSCTGGYHFTIYMPQQLAQYSYLPTYLPKQFWGSRRAHPPHLGGHMQPCTGRLGPSKKKRENRRPEFENHQVENPKGIETWPDLDLTTFLWQTLLKIHSTKTIENPNENKWPAQMVRTHGWCRTPVDVCDTRNTWLLLQHGEWSSICNRIPHASHSRFADRNRW